MILEIIVIIFALFAISRSFVRLRNGGESILEFILWVVVWTGVVVIVTFPSLTGIPARILNIGRGVDVFIYLGMIVLFYLVYRIYAKIENMERDITKLCRIMAEKQFTENEKNDKKKKN